MTDATGTLSHATAMWNYACRNPDQVMPTLTLLRPGGPLVCNVVEHHDSNGRALLQEGVIPLMAPSVDMAALVYGPLWKRLGVYAAVFVAGATILSPDGQQRTLMAWTCHPSERLEVTWCKAIVEDGSLRDVPLDQVTVVGTDWIKAALS